MEIVVVLIALCLLFGFRYFMFAYIVMTPVPSYPKTQARLKISYAQVNWTIGAPCLGLAIGQLFWLSFAELYGRRVVLIVSVEGMHAAEGRVA